MRAIKALRKDCTFNSLTGFPASANALTFLVSKSMKPCNITK